MTRPTTRQLILFGLAAALAVAVAVRLLWPGGDEGAAATGTGPTAGDLADALDRAGDPAAARFLDAVDQADRPAVTQLLRWLSRDDPARHAATARAIAEHAKAPGAREAAILQWGGGEGLDHGLMARLVADRSQPPDVRAAAVRALGSARAWDRFPEIRAALADDHLAVRQSAFAAVDAMLGGMGFGYDPAAAPADRAAAIRRLDRHPAFPPGLRSNPF